MPVPFKIAGSKVAMGVETDFGTAVSTTLSCRFESDDTDERPETVYPGLLDTEGEQSEAVLIATRVDGSTKFPAGYQNAGLGMHLYGALGARSTAGSGPYAHTFTTDKDLPSFTREVVIGDSGKSLTEYGMRINTFDLTVEARGLGSVTVGWLGKGANARDTTGTIPAYVGSPYRVKGLHGGTLSFNSATYVIKRLSFKVNNKLTELSEYGDLESGDIYIDGMREITAEVTFNERAHTLHAAMQAGTKAAFSIAYTDSTRSLTINGSTVQIVDYRAPLDGKGPVEATATFRFLADVSGGTKACSVVLVNGDTTYGAS